jgi:hypothetical protein
MGLVRMSETHAYTTSKDYARLWTLARTTPVVCIIDSYEECRDVACTLHHTDAASLQVSARGIGYIWAETIEDFAKQCHTLDLEWIPPEGAS